MCNKVLTSSGFQKPSLKPVSSHLFSVDGSPLSVKGMSTVTLCSNQHNFSTSVIVVDNLAEEAILGLDFLDNYSCTIDVPQRRLALFLDTTYQSYFLTT